MLNAYPMASVELVQPVVITWLGPLRSKWREISLERLPMVEPEIL